MGLPCPDERAALIDRRRRAFLADPPAPGGRAVLDPEESHHLARVLRLRAGDEVAVFDGRGGEWWATIDAITPTSVAVTIGAAATASVEPPLRIALVQAYVRPEKLEWVVQKGTEVGVGAFHFVPSERSDAPAPNAPRVERFRRIALEACKQSGRRSVPLLAVGEWPQALPASSFLLDPSAGAVPIDALLRGPAREEIAIAVGPEGGFSPGEVAAFTAAHWSRVSLGPRVLRTETAGVVAAAIVLHRWGDLGTSSGGAGDPLGG